MEFLESYKEIIAISILFCLIIFSMRRLRKLANALSEVRRKANMSQRRIKDIISKIAEINTAGQKRDTQIQHLKTVAEDSAGQIDELKEAVKEQAKAETVSAGEIADLKKAINHRALLRRMQNLSGNIDLLKLLPDKFVLINNAGQSNGAGRGAPRQTEDPHNALCLRRGGNGEEVLPLSIRNSSQTPAKNRQSLGNCPMFAFAQMYQQLLMEENGLPEDAGGRQPILVQTSQPAKGIEELGPGSPAFSHFKRAITRLPALLGPKQPFLVGATLWTQGEQDRDMPRDDYARKMVNLAEEFNKTVRRTNDQGADHLLLTWQVCSSGLPVALAQLDATRHPKIFMSGPSYQFDYDDDLHLTSNGLDGVGALYGLAWKRLYVDKTTWEPLKPVGSSVFGRTVILSFNKDILAFDTEGVPAQPDFGFSARVKGVAIALDNVVIINGNQVKITFKKAVPQNTVIAYGATPAVGKGPYLGGAGNLRDTQGAVVKFGQEPLHNWCVLFEWQL